MTVIIFLVILTVLVFVHELGHFISAKKSGVRVDEFAIGFPPTLLSKKVGETTYKLNIIPFGGYVKIHGENPDEDSMCGADSTRSFVNAKRWKQAIIISAGVVMNLLIAWPLFTASFISGVAAPANDNYKQYTGQTMVLVVSTEKNSPAEKSGLMAGDELISIYNDKTRISEVTVEKVQNFIKTEAGDIVFEYRRNGNIFYATTTPTTGIVAGRKAVGVAMSEAASMHLPLHLAAWEGLKYTGLAIIMTFKSLYGFLWQIVTGHADFSQVSGPVGIVGMVGSAKAAGWTYVVSFAAMISINLAVLNMIPFPALDGGRLLFIIIESIRRKSFNPKVANVVNAVGFGILILLMIVISVKDVWKLF
ncbi:MAG: M50 family metallopeptidase [bacterium]